MGDIPQADEVYCFLDTDVLLHFTDFDHVDWGEFLNAKQVYLVLSITVIHELNKHKDDGSKPGLQHRARTLLPKIAKVLVGAHGPVRIKEGVFLMASPKEPRIKWSALELDENVQDDRILARLLLFQEEYPERDVRFLTNDYAALLKADDRDIPTLMPDGKVLVQKTLKSSIEAELEAARKELSEYKNRAPKLEFGFDDGQKIISTMTLPSSGYNVSHAKVLAQAFNNEYVPKKVVSQRVQFERIVTSSTGQISDGTLKEFTNKYEAYLEKLEPALKRELMSKFGRRCTLTFFIKNSGTSPITDLTIELTFPPGTLVIDGDNEAKEIVVPEEPKPSWVREAPSTFGIGSLAHMNVPSSVFIKHDPTYDLLHFVRASQATYRGPFCNQTVESHIVSYHAKKLRHGGEWSMPPVVAYLIPENSRGFPIQYEISSDQGIRKISGSLSVQWKPTTNGQS